MQLNQNRNSRKNRIGAIALCAALALLAGLAQPCFGQQTSPKENEEAAIDACRLLALAEERYKATLHADDPASHYASRFVSTPGAQDGLYFGAESPIPAFLANAGVSDADVVQAMTRYNPGPGWRRVE